MNPSELLRYNWKPTILRLALAALQNGGPCGLKDWATRAGVPRNHVLPALQEAKRLGLVSMESMAEGYRVLVQPVSFWRERELCERGEWERSWRTSGQARLALATEAPGLTEALAQSAETHRNPVGQPESGLPESGADNRNPVPSIEIECTREKKILSSRVDRDRDRDAEEHAAAAADRAWLMQKLRRMPRLEQEICKPQSGHQQRMGRLFWELEGSDGDWLRDRVGELADRHEVGNKAAWLNRVMTQRAAMKNALKPK